MDDHNQEHQNEAPKSNPVPEGEGPRNTTPDGPVTDGRIPPELREKILEHFASFDNRLYEELNEEDCLELSEFLDLDEMEREAAREKAKRQR
jgi:hypothetical protein